MGSWIKAIGVSVLLVALALVLVAFIRVFTVLALGLVMFGAFCSLVAVVREFLRG